MGIELAGLTVLVALSLWFRWWSTHIPVITVVHGHFVAICYPHCSTQAPFSALMVGWLPARLDLFALGMLLAVLSAWWTERDGEPAWLSNRLMPWLCWAGAAVTFYAVGHLGVAVTPLFLTTPIQGIKLQTLYGIFAFLLIAPAVFGPQDRSLIRRLLQSWPLASLGVISYGIYLWHLNLINQVLSWTGDRSGHVSWFVLATGVFVVTVAISTLSYFGVERPILNIKNHLGWWSRSTTRSTESPDVLEK